MSRNRRRCRRAVTVTDLVTESGGGDQNIYPLRPRRLGQRERQGRRYASLRPSGSMKGKLLERGNVVTDDPYERSPKFLMAIMLAVISGLVGLIVAILLLVISL